MRSQKTEVIQVQCANRGTRDTEKKQKHSNTRPKHLQQLFLLLFLLPVDWGWGAPMSQAVCALRTGGSYKPRCLCSSLDLGFLLNSPGLGGFKGSPERLTALSPGQLPDPWTDGGHIWRRTSRPSPWTTSAIRASFS